MIAGVADSIEVFTAYDITTEAATDATSIVRAPISASFALQDMQLNENMRMNQKTLAAGTAVPH